jgi:hypothetical protein
MFISQYEIDYRKATTTHIGKELFGRQAMYYHLVDDHSENPEKPPLQVCQSAGVVAGIQGEPGQVPFLVDLAVPTTVDGIFVLLEKLEVSAIATEGPDEVADEIGLVEYHNAERIINAVNHMQDQRQKPKRNHLSLVVDNVNTVEALVESLHPKMELNYAVLIEALEQHVSISLMPSAKTTHFRHHVPAAIKAEDDGHFLRILRDQGRSGFFYRDALRKGEVYAVIAIDELVFMVGLRSHFTVWVKKDTERFYDMHEQMFTVDREAFMQIVRSL